MNVYLVIIKNVVSFNVRDLFDFITLLLCTSFSTGFVLGAKALVLGSCVSGHCL